jgi:hypothetical protein
MHDCHERCTVAARAIAYAFLLEGPRTSHKLCMFATLGHFTVLA